jgi:hypothetical protein
VNELEQRMLAANVLQSVPVCVIAKVSSGIARQTRRQLGSLHRVQKLMERCIPGQ